jgi:hypothetical protein
VILERLAFAGQMMAQLRRQHAFGQHLLELPARPDSPRIDSASLFCTWASSWSISSTGMTLGAFCFFGFFVVITSVMEFPFRYYFMTLFTQKICQAPAIGKSAFLQ